MYTLTKTTQQSCVQSITSKYICYFDSTQIQPDDCTKALINSTLSHSSCEFQMLIPIKNTTIGWDGQYELQLHDDTLFLKSKDTKGLFNTYETIHMPPPILKTMHKRIPNKPNYYHHSIIIPNYTKHRNPHPKEKITNSINQRRHIHNHTSNSYRPTNPIRIFKNNGR